MVIFLQNDPLEPDRKCRYNPFDLRFDPIYSLSQSGNLPIKDCFSILPMIKYKIYFFSLQLFRERKEIMNTKRIVVALGHSALGKTFPEQKENVKKSCECDCRSS